MEINASSFWPDPSIKIGHATNFKALTGCTVILVEEGAVGGVDVRGSAPGTRETDLLRPLKHVPKVHAILLTGGSAFGLEAASGVMRWLEEKGVGHDTSVARVPIVPAAVLYDLGIGDPTTRPDKKMGYLACQNANRGPVPEGNVGAGTGAVVAKFLGTKNGFKGGLGFWQEKLGQDLLVSALVVVNAIGDVLNEEGKILAGPRDTKSGKILSTLDILRETAARGETLEVAPYHALNGLNTTLAVIITNGCLNKEETNKVAQMAHDGLARSISPVHTMFDGDIVFTLATGSVKTDVNIVGAVAAEITTIAIRRAVRLAQSAGGIPAVTDIIR